MKKNCNIDKCGHFFDTLFWWTLYALPIVATLLLNMNESLATIPLKMYSIVNELFGAPLYNGVVYDTLKALFGNTSTAILRMFSDDVIFMLSWFVNMHIIHLAVDVLVFIPRWSHRMIDKFMKEV